ncbi:hypothetical protein SAMN05216559_1239 [Halomicrobium zhouii]|uniref:Pycsar effector protein domain-containing protein n=1 Tax=Halomicrobium zhouii TaxID=767519 RepID=A0A1I6KPQ8_9EURY|nr:hypothetical protein [Halomicrobium zhouii]SFR93196.1 hypothetical protein SAMN05216559_1239 [Halomicrobium zhouii]
MAEQDEFDSEIDLLHRYEQMIQTQVETLNGIDDKAAYVARLVGILAGLILTGVSLIASNEGFAIGASNGGALALAALAITSLFVSLVYAIVTYLSSKFEYGPSAGIGDFMSQAQVPEQEYKDVLLRGYSQAIRANRRVVVTNARRFERCLASFASGLLLFFGVGVVLVLLDESWIDLAVVFSSVTIALVFSRYILREEYLTLDRQIPTDD